MGVIYILSLSLIINIEWQKIKKVFYLTNTKKYGGNRYILLNCLFIKNIERQKIISTNHFVWGT